MLEALEDRSLPSTFTVTSILDNGDVGTLRWAIDQANATTGANTIDFDPTVFGTPQTITLSGTELDLDNPTGAQRIEGPKVGVTVSGDNLSRVFDVAERVTASISGRVHDTVCNYAALL
jgi:hypothetical protein